MKPDGNKFSLAKKWLIDLLFPRHCVGCSAYGYALCPKCCQSLKNSRFDFCPGCGEVFTGGLFCAKCGKNSNLSGLFVLTDFHNPIVKNIVHAIKYDFVFSLADELEDLIKQKLANHKSWRVDAALIPVPLYRQRLLWRGFNQSLLISKAISRITGNEVIEDLLVRIKNNKPQVGLKSLERVNNVKDVFGLNPKSIFSEKSKSVVIIDDVYTTGSTMQECARILKIEGFNEVWGLVLAKD